MYKVVFEGEVLDQFETFDEACKFYSDNFEEYRSGKFYIEWEV